MLQFGFPFRCGVGAEEDGVAVTRASEEVCVHVLRLTQVEIMAQHEGDGAGIKLRRLQIPECLEAAEERFSGEGELEIVFDAGEVA